MLVDGAETAVAIGATINLFLGRPIEFIGTPSVGKLLITADDPDVTMSWTINVGGVQHVPVAAGSVINVAPVTGGGPKEDEDIVIMNVPMPAGSRNQLSVTNTGAQATNVRYRVVILP
jgi:hypothetical protein